MGKAENIQGKQFFRSVTGISMNHGNDMVPETIVTAKS